MIRLAVSVEGQTEEEFVKGVLKAHLLSRDIEADPILIGAGTDGGGGNVTVKRLTSDMARLYHSHDVVTSLVDFYGFLKKGDRTVDALEAHILQTIGEQIGEGWDQNRVFPYVQRHEFEGLLFSNVNVFATQNDFPDDCVAALLAVREQFTIPEDINDSPQTAPSKRIAGVIPRYNKRLHGPILAEEIGLDTIRAECPRFNAWVTYLESLGE